MANQGLNTVDDILKQGCQQGGNPGLLAVPAGETISYALRAFRTGLHHIYLTYDFPFLETEGSITVSAGNQEVSLASLTRYRSINAVFINTVGRLEQTDYKSLWLRSQTDLSQSPDTTGIPTHFAISPDRSKLLLYPIPTAAYTGKILYYRIPDVSGYTGATAANSIDFEDSLALVKMMEEFSRNWDKDNFVAMTSLVAEKVFGQYRVAAEDQGRDRGPIEMKLGKRFRYRKGD